MHWKKAQGENKIRGFWFTATVLIGLAIVVIFLLFSVRWADRDVRNELLRQTRMVSGAVDLQHVIALSGTKADLNSPDYLRLKEQLIRIRSANEKCRFIYLWGRNPKGEIFFYVDSEPAGSKDESPAGQIYNEASQNVRRIFLTKEAIVEGPDIDRWGTWVSAYVPLVDPRTGRLVAFLGMDVDAKEWQQDIAREVALPVGLVIIILSFSGFSVLLLRANRIIRVREQSLMLTQFVVDQAQDAVFLIEKDGKFVYVNQGACKRMGYSHEELLQMGVFDINPVFPKAAWIQHWKEIQRKGSFSLESSYRTKGGEVFPVEVSVNLIKYGDKEYNCSIARDITERKKAEEVINKAYHTTRDILEKSPLGIFVVNDTGNIDYVNPAMLKMSGDTYLQFVSLNVFELPTYKSIGLSEKIKSALNGEYFSEKSLSYVSHFNNKTTVRNYLGMPFEEEGKKKALIFVEDVTERDNLEKMKTSLTHMIVHDLNNPLSGILGYLSLLPMEMQAVISAPQKEAFKTMLQAATEMKDMISDLLDIDKMEEGKFKLRYEDVDLDALFKEIGDSMKVLAQGEKKALSFDVSPGLSVWADRTILKRIVSNLFGNALKFAFSGSTISVSGRYDDNSRGLMVSVKDRGAGISKEYLSRVFDKFVQVESAQEKGRTGKGLGLTFCKMAVEAHGGKIWVESQVGEGSIFYFVLPGKSVKDKAVREVEGR